MAGYPKRGNLIPKALFRTFDPVEAAISSRVGFPEAPTVTELSDPLRFNFFWTFLEIDIILIAFFNERADHLQSNSFICWVSFVKT